MSFRQRIPRHEARGFSVISTPEEVAVYDPSRRDWIVMEKYRIVARTTTLR